MTNVYRIYIASGRQHTRHISMKAESEAALKAVLTNPTEREWARIQRFERILRVEQVW